MNLARDRFARDRFARDRFARDRFAKAIATLSAIALLAACSGDSPSTTATPGPTLPPGVSSTLEAPTTFGPPPSPTAPDDSSPVVIDSTLLAFLPESLAGVAVNEDIDEAAHALSDAGLPLIATALDAAVAVDGGNLVLAWIVRLRPDRFTLDTYRQWRDSYDDGACTAAGGVVGHAQAEIGGRQAFVTSCQAGLHTYHVWLEEQNVLISASSVGEGRFGEQLMAGLRVPA